MMMALKLFSNPITMPPVISEFYYNNGDWQIELYFDQMHEIWIQDFSDLRLHCNSGFSTFIDSLPFQYDSIIVIDQSSLNSIIYINPDDDFIKLFHLGYGQSIDVIYYGPFTIMGDDQIIAPKDGQSIVRNYFNNLNGDDFYKLMLDDTPSIGSDQFISDSRATFSGYVFDQYSNPVPDLNLVYCNESYCYGGVAPAYSCLQTDENGYFESDEMFCNWHLFKLQKDDFIFSYDTLCFEPDSVYYKEYILIDVGIPAEKPDNDISILAAPNPFNHKTSFHISMPDYFRWNDAQITIRSINGQLVDVIHFPNAVWSGNVFSIDWYPAMTGNNVIPGLYLYSLEVDGKVILSEKLIINK